MNLGGNRAPARGRNRNSRPEPTPQAALAGFLGPAGMAGGSKDLETVRVEVSGRQPVDHRPCLSLKARPAHCRDHTISMADLSLGFINLSDKLNACVLIPPPGIIEVLALIRASKLIPSKAGILRQCAGFTIEVGCKSVGGFG